MATITISVVTVHSHKTDYSLSINNMVAGAVAYNNFTITCDCDSTTHLSHFGKFTASQSKPTQYILTPDKQYVNLPPNQILTDVFTCRGTVPSNFQIVTSAPTPVGDIYNFDFTKMTDLKGITGFTYQYDYTKQSGYSISTPNPQYFTIENGGLQISIYKGDKPFKAGDTTMPRSEMRGLSAVYDDTNYLLKWTSTLTAYSATTEFSFAQVFGNGKPNVMLRYRNGTYELLCIMGGQKNLALPLAGQPVDDVGKTIEWQIDFRLSTSGGYIHVIKDGVTVGSMTGNTSGGNGSYLKIGLYMQQMEPVGTLTEVLKNLLLTIKA